jgi:hypothetical protein
LSAQEFVADIGTRHDALDWIESLWRGDWSDAAAVSRGDRIEQPIVAARPNCSAWSQASPRA